METTKQVTKIESPRRSRGFISDPQVYHNKEQETLTHVLADNVRIEMPVNFYKKALGIPFEKKESSKSNESPNPRKKVFGLVAKPNVYVTKDGQYLVHRVFEIYVSKHVNYYKKILGVEFTPKALNTLAVPA